MTLTPHELQAAAAERRRAKGYDALRTTSAENQPALSRDERAVLGPVVEQLDQLLSEGHTIDNTVVTRTLLARRSELNAVIAATTDDDLRELLIDRAAARVTTDPKEEE
jgi:hypothetical protein